MKTDKPKTDMLQFLVPPEQKKFIETDRRRLGLNVSEWLRHALACYQDFIDKIYPKE